jgi:hypothetical protein
MIWYSFGLISARRRVPLSLAPTSNLCATCYTLKRQEEEDFGGLREDVLERDGYALHDCSPSGAGQIGIEADDFAMPWMPYEGPPNEGCAVRDATATAGAMARTAPRRTRANRA